MGEIKTTFDRDHDLTINTATGKITVNDIFKVVQEYLLEEPTNKVLWNFLEADGSEILSDEFQLLHHYVSEQPAGSMKRKIAVVVSRQVCYGLARQSQAYADISGVQAEYHIVSSQDEAMEWLNK